MSQKEDTSEEMRGIDADTEPLRLAAAAQDESQFLEGPAERRSLASRRFQRNARLNFRNHAADRVKTRHNFLESRFDATTHVRARMQHEKWKAKLVCPHEFLA